MKAQVSTAVAALAGAALLLAAAAQGAPAPRDAKAPATAAQKGVPTIDQLVVFRSGKALAERVAARRTTARVDGRECAVGAATAMAALLRSKPGPISLHDYGTCSRKPADAAGLFVMAMRGERNRNQDGWVYKVGRRLATAGAADPTGPFGSGRLRTGDRVVWFYCRQLSNGTCQRSLEVETAVDGRRLSATVTGYDDSGDGVPIAGATVQAGSKRAATDADGKATLTLPRGRVSVHATKAGAIRSFAKRVRVG